MGQWPGSRRRVVSPWREEIIRGGDYMKPVTVLVVDDDPAIRDGLVAILEIQAGLQPIGEAADGLEAVEMARDLRPDVVLMDANMPQMDGLEATRRIKQDSPDTHIIVLTVYPTHVSEAFAAGANRYLLKDSSPRELLEAIREQSS